MQSRRDTIRLRAHHLVCIHLFSGAGYSADFVRNLHAIVQAMDSGLPIEIVEGQDDVCAPCPHNTGDACAKDNDKVLQMDNTMSSILSINSGATFKNTYIRELIDKALIEDLLPKACNDCEWFALRCRPLMNARLTGRP